MSGIAPNPTGVDAPKPAGPPMTEAGGEARRRTAGEVLKDIVLFFAAPFVTLAYLPLFPFIGLATLIQTWRHRKEAA